MPFNGSGTFNRVYNWVTDKNNSINITASRVDTEDTGFATGLSNCICKDGQTTITANLPMSGFLHTGVGDATARTNYAVVGQIQDSTYNWVAGGGTADAITATYAPAVTALVDGMELKFRATAANATATPTFAPNGLTAHTITQKGGSALVANNIPGNLAECTVRYNLANTRWELLNPAFVVAAASITEAMLLTADNTTADVTSTKHGFAPKSPADATKFLNGAATNAYAQVKDSDLSTSDITTNDVSTSKHGFAPKGDGSTTKFLNANGAYSTPTQIMTPLGVGSTLWASTTTTKAAGATIAASSLTAKNPILIGASTGTVSTGDSLSGTYQAMQTIANTSGEVGQWQRTV